MMYPNCFAGVYFVLFLFEIPAGEPAEPNDPVTVNTGPGNECSPSTLAGGADHFMWSTDYPHQASTFPHTQDELEKAFQDVPAADKQKIVRDNASKLYGLPVE